MNYQVIEKLADTILTQMPGGIEDREQKEEPPKIIKEINKEEIDEIINGILGPILRNSRIISLEDLLPFSCKPCMKKKALTIGDLIDGTSKRSIKYEPGCTAKLKRSSPKLGRWMFTVKCTEKWSKGPYDVRFRLLKKGPRYRDVVNRQIEVSCPCKAWQYNGADYNALQNEYSERQFSDGSPPNVRDRRRKYLICKHVAACAPSFVNYIVPKGFK